MGRSGSCTDTEFQRMRDQHLPYELLMLQAAAAIVSESEPFAEDTAALLRRWMAIECFYIHLRTLHDFFYDKRGKESDAVASDFFGDPVTWRRLRPRSSLVMKEAVRLAGTMVAHLSYSRQTNIEAGKGLQWLKLIEEMDAVYTVFRHALTGSPHDVPLGRGFKIAPGDIITTTALEYGPATTVSTPGDISKYLHLLTISARGR